MFSLLRCTVVLFVPIFANVLRKQTNSEEIVSTQLKNKKNKLEHKRCCCVPSIENK